MDGRWFRRWVVCGGLAAALAGCNRNTYPDAPGLPKTGAGPVGPAAPGKGLSLWGGGGPRPDPAPGVPGDAPPAAPSSGKKKGLSADAQVTFADTWAAVALSDPPPPNRDQLLDQARQTYQGVLKKDPRHGPATLGMARLYARTGERERAVEQYRAYLKANPADHAVVHEVAVAHARWKDMAGAVAWCDEALKADPQNRTYRKMRGFCMVHAGQWQEGFAALCEVMPEPQARFNLAMALDQMNQPDQSRQQLALALQADPNFAPARDLLAALEQAGQAQPPAPAAESNPVRQAGFAP